MALLAPLPLNETERQNALDQLRIMDTAPEPSYNELAYLASYICGTPISTVTLIDSQRQWFKAAVGARPGFESPRDESFCAHAILGNDLFIVEDAAEDQRFHDNPHVENAPHIRFYAGAPLLCSGGSALGTLCVIDTVPHRLTDQQRQALKSLGRQVEQLLELRRTRTQLEAALEAKSQFLRMASHDLKNPLSVVLGGMSVLRENMQGTDDYQLDHETSLIIADSVVRQARKMRTLIQDYLDAQALDDGKLSLRWKEEDLGTLLTEVVDDLKPYAESKESTIRLRIAPDLSPTPCDGARITQVAMNFLSNALKFSPQGSTITVRLHTATQLPPNLRPSPPADGSFLIAEFQDQGPGISEDDSARLFAQYEKLTARPTAGESSSGLGLDICRQLMEMHEGQVGVHNNPEGGATFWFALKANSSPE